jgi:hypothetical protein
MGTTDLSNDYECFVSYVSQEQYSAKTDMWRVDNIGEAIFTRMVRLASVFFPVLVLLTMVFRVTDRIG